MGYVCMPLHHLSLRVDVGARRRIFTVQRLIFGVQDVIFGVWNDIFGVQDVIVSGVSCVIMSGVTTSCAAPLQEASIEPL